MGSAWTVEGIDHLADMHEWLFADRRRLGRHHGDVVELAHARWATGSAITALDLCAGALARLHCGWTKDKLPDVRSLDPNEQKHGTQLYDRLPQPAQKWVDKVVGDRDYRVVLDARNPFTHSRLGRTISVGNQLGVRSGRTAFHLPRTTQPVSTDLIRNARKLSARHVEEFLGGVLSGQL